MALPGQPVSIPLPPGRTSGLRVERAGPSDGSSPSRRSRSPGSTSTGPSCCPECLPAGARPTPSCCPPRTGGERRACRSTTTCAAGSGRGRAGEEPGALDRTIRLGAGAAYDVSARVTPVDGDALQGLIQRDQLVNVRASSTAVEDARGSAVAAIDGDPGTTWIADPDDEDPDPVGQLAGRADRAVRPGDARPSGRRRRRRRGSMLEYPGGQPVGRARRHRDRARRPVPDPPARHPFRRRPADHQPARRRHASRRSASVSASSVWAGPGCCPIALSDQPVDIGCAFGPTLRVGTALYPRR